MTGPEILPCESRPGVCTAHLSAAGRRWVLLVTILGSSLAFIDGSVVNVALPAIERGLGATLADVQWVVNGYTLFLAALILVGGAAGDRYGRRLVFLLGIAIFTAASVLCGLAPNVIFLEVTRGIQGIGAALLVPNSLALISANVEEKDRAAAIGTWAGFAALTTAFGPVLGGWIIDSASWRGIFFINIPLAAVAFVLARWRIHESALAAADKPDWTGTALITAGLASLTFGLIEAPVSSITPLVSGGSIATGSVLLCAFVLYEAAAPAPMLRLTLFASRNFTVANLLTLLLYFSLSGSLFFLPFDLIQYQGYTAAQAGASLLPFTLIMGALSRATGRLADALGARMFMVGGPCLSALGLGWLAFTAGTGSYWYAICPAMITLGVGMALGVPALTTTVMSAAGDANAGTASGVNNAVARTAGLIAVAGLGLIAVWGFDNVMRAGLTHLSAHAGFHHDLKFGGLNLPAGIPVSVRALITAAARRAFLHAFRLIMLISAASAAVAAVVGCFVRPEAGRAVATVPD